MKQKEQILITRKLTNIERVYLNGLTGKLRKTAFRLFMENMEFEKVTRRILLLQHEEKIKETCRPAVTAMVNTILEMQKNKISVPLQYYEVALNLDYADDYEFFGKQALIMLQSYDPNGSGMEYRNLKTLMFNTIHECFDRGIVPHPLMFDFVLEGGWISEMTFLLFHRHIREIEHQGLNGKLLIPLRKMFKARKNDPNPVPAYTCAEENYFRSLLALLSRPQKKEKAQL